MIRRLVLALACASAFAVAACDVEDPNATSSGSSDSSGEKAEKKKSCTNKATDECTPSLMMGKRVRVDALLWNVTGVETAKALGDQTYGLGAKADGTFVIVNLKVRSDRNESATLTDEIVQLDIGGNTYKADSDGTLAAIGNGDQPMWFEDIGPDSTMTSKVVFDVPDSKLGSKIKVRFGEIGFGSTHGFIRIPPSRL